jgi:hypothetical protein
VALGLRRERLVLAGWARSGGVPVAEEAGPYYRVGLAAAADVAAAAADVAAAAADVAAAAADVAAAAVVGEAAASPLSDGRHLGNFLDG